VKTGNKWLHHETLYRAIPNLPANGLNFSAHGILSMGSGDTEAVIRQITGLPGNFFLFS
jgi:hypothetical protein